MKKYFRRVEDFKEVSLVSSEEILITEGIEGTIGEPTKVLNSPKFVGNEEKFNEIVKELEEAGYVETKEQEKFPKSENDVYEEEVSDIILKEIEGREDIENLCVSAWSESYEEGPGKIVDYLIENKEKYQDTKYFTFGNMNSEVCEMSWIWQWSYKDFFKAFPNIKGFSVQGTQDLTIGKLDLPELEILEIQGSGLDEETVREIAESNLPKLKKLNLFIGVEEYGCTVTTDSIKALLNEGNFPELINLGICNMEQEFCLDAIKEIFNSKYASQIKVLDISKSMITDKEGEYILENIEKLSNIKYININYNFFSKEMLEKLEALDVEINLSGNEEIDMEDDGYIYSGPMYTE